MLRHAIRNYRNAQASEVWPSVDGELVKLKLWGKRNVDGQIKEVENLSLKYKFTVAGNEYTGTNVAFYTLVYPETVEFAEGRSEKSQVTVYFNPDNPVESVLMPGLKGDNKRYSEFILGTVGLFISIAITIAGALGVIG